MGAPTGPFVLGIDAGSRSIRSGVFGLDGTLLGAATHPIDTSYPRVSWAEQNAEDWWKAVRITVPAALAQAGLRGEDLAALSVDATSCTVVCCRRDGSVLRPAIMWMDQRAFAEARKLTSPGPRLQYVSGHVSPEWMIPKALWLRANEPEVYADAELIIEATDWLSFRLTGEWTASRCNATAKWNYARPAGGYPVGLLAAVDAPELLDKWPSSVLALGAPAGEISARAAAGLKAGTPVARGGIDAYAATLGSGVVEPGRLAMVMGSSTCHMALSDRPIFAPSLGPVPGRAAGGPAILEGGQTATGSIISWLAENFSCREMERARGEDNYTVLDEAAANSPARGPGGPGLLAGQPHPAARPARPRRPSGASPCATPSPTSGAPSWRARPWVAAISSRIWPRRASTWPASTPAAAAPIGAVAADSRRHDRHPALPAGAHPGGGERPGHGHLRRRRRGPLPGPENRRRDHGPHCRQSPQSEVHSAYLDLYRHSLATYPPCAT